MLLIPTQSGELLTGLTNDLQQPLMHQQPQVDPHESGTDASTGYTSLRANFS